MIRTASAADPAAQFGPSPSRRWDGVWVHGRFYRAILWNLDRMAVELPPRHLVDRRV